MVSVISTGTCARRMGTALRQAVERRRAPAPPEWKVVTMKGRLFADRSRHAVAGAELQVPEIGVLRGTCPRMTWCNASKQTSGSMWPIVLRAFTAAG